MSSPRCTCLKAVQELFVICRSQWYSASALLAFLFMRQLAQLHLLQTCRN